MSRVDSDESDWTILFTHWGIPMRDQQIGLIIRALGWHGMLAAVAWLSDSVYYDGAATKVPLTEAGFSQTAQQRPRLRF